ncbi:MAG: HupE/UreJ family protein [Hoeflea sp.]|uniref:HupE/UreJ family protein n=1 Tax=Hoeflea sp. TaxID=1940281 RepID=UPI001DC9F25F|nr:HupE/UreJ family protein [Hoeflea sp.]MBU4527631.1 HupE/UreJ family protein [Alphaproteobacteria bacterium]MBU4546501.1 HupE/UreJ family protein [Alphaproteobacteria bacterium]MBU4552981.1 HupE/UreJ family protein [Alphaproteobacteria bacterium]MBV1724053.1 HupE/UreJ family protein [Hoeflea sp.]MBV1759738.1 HupE/UreJ family protein [Hoeflea sp.]
MIRRLLMTAAALGLATAPALAHLDPSEHGSFAAGFSHPLFGLDHILVMVAVGLWAASLKGRAMLAVPAAFVGTMGLGFIAAIAGVPLPFVEPVILASIIFIGIMVALALPFSTAGMAAAVAFFAFFHGHAHGGELGEAGAASFALGFMIATALLHAAGIGLGLAFAKLQRRDGKSWITRAAGAATAVAGVVLAVAG